MLESARCSRPDTHSPVSRGSARRSRPDTHLCHVDWSEALSSDQAGLVPGVAAQCPMMLFCDLYKVKLDCLRPPSPSRQSLSLSQKESELHNLIIRTIKITFLLYAKRDHDFFQLLLPFSLTEGFDLLLIVFIDVTLLTYLYDIMH